MTYTAIKVENLAKQYRIGHYESANRTLVETISRTLKLQFLRDLKSFRKNRKYFWALDDISFEVKQGEVIGIIGHNGAGKSTLLKILSRITEPSRGFADIYGRVGSLLEVGTGFHLELTGRENIYLSGAILGMKKNDIDRRFDEIVAFAGVEKFVDTPVKHYSSGMHLRLAFAVAAHLEPDILLVDEVLAVGDLEFQKKCLNKMENVATEGRTVLFVSHNMGSIKELCQKALVIKNGKIDYFGNVVAGIRHYSRSALSFDSENGNSDHCKGWMTLRVNDQKELPRVVNTEAFEVTSDLIVPKDINHASIHCYMEDTEGAQIVHNRELGFADLRTGRYRVQAQVPPLYLKPGVYTLYLKLVGNSEGSYVTKYLSERMVVDVADGTKTFNGQIRAAVLPPVRWSFVPAEASETIPA